MSAGLLASPIILHLCDLVAPSGVGYSELASTISGRTVVLDGMLVGAPDGTLLVSEGTGLDGCEHEAPVVTVTLVEPSHGLRQLPCPSPVKVIGIFEYGFQLDERRTATYVRLRSGRIYE